MTEAVEAKIKARRLAELPNLRRDDGKVWKGRSVGCEARHGDCVVYHGSTQSQVNYGGHSDPRGVLKVGNAYRVENVVVEEWSSNISLEGYRGKFNTVCFHGETDEGEWVEE
jgi:hypothetical protein